MTGRTPTPVRDAQALVDRLAQQIGEDPAAAWVHTAAVAQHAAALGLIQVPVADTATGRLQAAAAALAAHPALAGFADPTVNPAQEATLTDWAACQIEALWARHSGSVTDRPDGYRLGDLYQTLSDSARTGRALCQTPRFVTDLILHCTLDRAVEDTHPADIRLIDPACGTGHMLVESFRALGSRQWLRRRAAATTPLETLYTTLGSVHGADLDSYAALLARYRLLTLACRMDARGWTLADAPHDLPIQVAGGVDSLLDDEPLLARGRYHVVVGNPPYITVKDAAVNEAVRRRWPQVCSGRYSLALPFFALMTELAVGGGWVGQITANSFMKREFGRKFVEGYLPKLDLQWVIDASGAYIPGHGTPTVILIHRNQPPASDTVKAVLGVRGEPKAPDDPAKGLVWTEICDAVWARESLDRFRRGAERAAGVDRPQPAPVAARPVPAPEPPVQPTLFDLLGAAS